MKKILLFLLVAVFAAGVVWGQSSAFSVNQLSNASGGSAVEKVGLWSFFVDETISTENRYSAGIFSSYADDFMWFTSYDPKVGTFLLLGGYPSDGKDIADTEVLSKTPYTLNFGLGKSLKSGYLGVYYGGNLVEANGTSSGLKDDDNITWSKSTWTNRLAILYGNEKIGGIRFDILFDQTTYEENDTDGKPRNNGASNAQTVSKAPQIALGWGKTLAKELEFYAQLGFKFADMLVITDAEGKKKDTIWGGVDLSSFPNITFDNTKNAKLALQAGIYKPLAGTENSESSFSVDFLIGNLFGASGEGDLTLDNAKFIQGGVFLLGAEAGYKNVIKVDEKLSFGFKPSVAFGFTVDDSNSALKGSKETYDATKTVLFEMATGVNIGLKYQINQKFGLYTGVGLEILNWRAGGYSEGKDEKYDKNNSDPTKQNLHVKSSAWKVTGINWKPETLTKSTNLGFGLTFAPSKNVVIGAGLNALLDKIIYFDLTQMKLHTGLDQPSTSGSELEWLSDNVFGGLEFDLTISVKF